MARNYIAAMFFNDDMYSGRGAADGSKTNTGLPPRKPELVSRIESTFVHTFFLLYVTLRNDITLLRFVTLHHHVMFRHHIVGYTSSLAS